MSCDSFVARIVTVVSPHIAPPISPSTSPCQVSPAPPWVKPSRSAKATPAKAQASPTHCTGRRRSVGTSSGTTSATQKGEV